MLIILLLIKKTETSPKAPKFKVSGRVGITKYKNTENWSREIVITDSDLKTNPLTLKLKDLSGEKIIGRFYEK